MPSVVRDAGESCLKAEVSSFGAAALTTLPRGLVRLEGILSEARLLRVLVVQLLLVLGNGADRLSPV